MLPLEGSVKSIQPSSISERSSINWKGRTDGSARSLEICSVLCSRILRHLGASACWVPNLPHPPPGDDNSPLFDSDRLSSLSFHPLWLGHSKLQDTSRYDVRVYIFFCPMLVLVHGTWYLGVLLRWIPYALNML